MARAVKAEPRANREDRRWRRAGNAAGSDDAVPQRPKEIPPPQRRREEQRQGNVQREEQQNQPEQDAAERRALRSRYLAVKNMINEERDEIYKPDSEKFESIFSEVQALHQQVHKPREQVADAEALLDITNSLLTSVKAHKSEGVTPADLINSLIRNFAQQDMDSSTSEDSGHMIHWKEIGLAVSHVFRRGPGCATMFGPMSFDFKQKQRKVSVRRRHDRHAERARPEELVSNKEEMTDTDKNMATMFGILKRCRKVQLEKLILNRNSFAQTVENLFALSFLMKDGRAEITVEEDGSHFVSPKNAPAANAVASGQVSYNHFVFRFDFKDWKLMLDTIDAGEELMPHREPTEPNTRPGPSNAFPDNIPPSEPEPAGYPTTPIRKLSRNRGLVIQEQEVVEDSPEVEGSNTRGAAIRKGKRKLL